MVKIIIFAVLGLVVGLGGGSAFSVMRAKKAFAADTAVRAKVVADSLAKLEEGGAKHAEKGPAHGDSTLAAADSATSEAGEATPHDAHTDAAKPEGEAEAKVGGEPAAAPHGATPTDTPAKSAGKAPRSFSRAVETVEAHGTPKSSAALSAVRLPALPPKPVPTTAQPAPGAAKVAKIFAAMPAKDAAKVLEQLDDSEVQAVLSNVSDKQAAAILQSFPATRAAAISKAVLRSALVKP